MPCLHQSEPDHQEHFVSFGGRVTESADVCAWEAHGLTAIRVQIPARPPKDMTTISSCWLMGGWRKGKRAGLQIRWCVSTLWVRFPPRPPASGTSG